VLPCQLGDELAIEWAGSDLASQDPLIQRNRRNPVSTFNLNHVLSCGELKYLPLLFTCGQKAWHKVNGLCHVVEARGADIRFVRYLDPHCPLNDEWVAVDELRDVEINLALDLKDVPKNDVIQALLDDMAEEEKVKFLRNLNADREAFL